MVRLIALRQLTGDYGRVSTGQAFEANAEVAANLEARGLAMRVIPDPPPAPPPVTIETHMQPPVENKMITAEEPPVRKKPAAKKPARKKPARKPAAKKPVKRYKKK